MRTHDSSAPIHYDRENLFYAVCGAWQEIEDRGLEVTPAQLAELTVRAYEESAAYDRERFARKRLH